MRTLCVLAFAGFMGLGWADSVTLRDGRVVNGTYLGGDSRSVRFAGSDRVETFSIDQISNIVFGDTRSDNSAGRRRDPEPRDARPSDARPSDARPSDERPSYVAPRREEPTRAEQQELKSGTTLTVRMIDSVDSQRDQVGKTF